MKRIFVSILLVLVLAVPQAQALDPLVAGGIAYGVRRGLSALTGSGKDMVPAPRDKGLAGRTYALGSMEGATFEAGFSPKGRSLAIILDAIGNAKRSVLVAAYVFTSRHVAEALTDAHRRGVRVMVVADAKSNLKGSALPYLADAGIPVRLNDKYQILHHKFMVIDGTDLQLGSFNYSASAYSGNAENVLYFRNAPDLAKTYAAEWETLFSEGIPYVRAGN